MYKYLILLFLSLFGLFNLSLIVKKDVCTTNIGIVLSVTLIVIILVLDGLLG